eukprot:Hpha_TRINITY_DN11013_c0_g3::TRINITY_DN11013_c0_g3_i1::g.92702::m.92702
MGQACCATAARDSSDDAGFHRKKKQVKGGPGAIDSLIADLDAGLSTMPTPVLGRPSSWDFRDHPLEDADMQRLAERLTQSHSLTNLRLLSRSISDVGCIALASALSAEATETTLLKLNLSFNMITDAGVRSFCEPLQNVSQQGRGLRSLSLLGNKLGEGALRSLGAILRENTSLEDVEVGVGGDGQCPVPADALEALAAGAAQNGTLTSLRVTGEGAQRDKRKAESTVVVDAEGIGVLFSALCHHRYNTLHTLRLQHTVLGDDRRPREGAVQAVARCAAMVISSTSLRVLDLEGNALGDDAARALADACGAESQLQQIILSKNCLGDSGLQAFGAALGKNNSIVKVDLHDQRGGTVTAMGLGGLFGGLKQNQKLTELNVAKIHATPVLPAPSARVLMELLEVNTTITDVRYGMIDEDGVRKAVEARLEANKASAPTQVLRNSPPAPDPFPAGRPAVANGGAAMVWRDGFEQREPSDATESEEVALPELNSSPKRPESDEGQKEVPVEKEREKEEEVELAELSGVFCGLDEGEDVVLSPPKSSPKPVVGEVELGDVEGLGSSPRKGKEGCSESTD